MNETRLVETKQFNKKQQNDLILQLSSGAASLLRPTFMGSMKAKGMQQIMYTPLPSNGLNLALKLGAIAGAFLAK